VEAGPPAYSMLLEFAEPRAFVLERCHPFSYVDAATGRPARPTGDFCEPWGQGKAARLADDDTLLVAGPRGDETRVPIRFGVPADGRAGAGIRLEIEWKGEKLLFAPGTRGDLLERFEALEPVRKAKARLDGGGP
jgi:hypothetical protein